MTLSKNTDLVHEGENYHIQTECWKDERSTLITQVFSSGKVVFKKVHAEINGEFSEETVNEAHEKVVEDFKCLLMIEI